MTRVVPLNNVDHAGLRVVTTRGLRWGDAVNRVPVFPTEFEAVQREYPILFGPGADGVVQAFALLGLDRDENLFLTGDCWDARYVPALADRGPFSIGLVPRGDGSLEPMLHVDLDHPRVTEAGEGEPLFRPHGGHSAYLDRTIEVLRRVHAGHEAQAPMIDALQAAALLKPTRLEVSLDETLRYDLIDFATIDLDRLAALDGATLAGLHAQGLLACAIHAASSLGNMAELIRRKNRLRAMA